MPKVKKHKVALKRQTKKKKQQPKKKTFRKQAGKNKKKYKVRNWHAYNEALKQRGALDVYFDNAVLEGWYSGNNGKKGAQPIYTDLAIMLTLQFGKIFGQRLRQAEGMMASLFRMMKINLSVPDFTTLSRRGGTIAVELPKNNKEKVIAIFDSSGLKLYGEGEWKVRKHGWSKHRTWLKMHIMIDKDGEIRGAELTGNDVTDSEAVEGLLAQEKAEIEAGAGDGAYDKRVVYEVFRKRGIKKILIPPQHNAKIFQHGNLKQSTHPRDENLRQIRKTSRSGWKQLVGYHVRSLVETTMFRFKTIFGDKIHARNTPQQRTEFLISCGILNKMTNLGMPDSYAVA